MKIFNHCNVKNQKLPYLLLQPIVNYGIPEKAQVLWDMEDVSLCKSLNFPRLIEKHKFNTELLKVFDKDYFRKTYSKYPKLHMLI